MFTAERTRTENKLLTFSFSPSYERRQLSPSYKRRQLSSSYKREQLEIVTKRVETKKHGKNDTHSKKITADIRKYTKGNVNREQHRSSDKSHGTMGRQ